MARILWAINTLTEIDAQVYPAHLNLAFRVGRDTNHEIALFTPTRVPIATARNAAARYALEGGYDYVFFMDDDMDPHRDTLRVLLSRDRDIIMALCYIRGYPYQPMVFKWVDKEDAKSRIRDVEVEGKFIDLWDDCLKATNPEGLIEPVAAVGCPVTLVKTEVFRQLDEPWFYTGTYNTEDVYFCIKAQQKIPGVTIAVDTTVPAGHLLKQRPIVRRENAEFLKTKDDEYSKLISEPGIYI